MEKLIPVLVIAAAFTCVHGHARCPLVTCADSIVSGSPRPGDELNEDFNQCVQNIETAKTCVWDALKQDDNCQLCQRDHFDQYANPAWVEKRGKNNCLVKHCSLPKDSMAMCSSKVQQLLMFYDTSLVDDITACIDTYNPAPGAKTCVSYALPFKFPGLVDPIQALKQILGEMKDGCDPVLPVVACRGEIKPLAGLIMGLMTGQGVGPASPTVIKAAYTGLVKCVSKKLKNSPCKTLSSIMNAAEGDIVNAVLAQIPMPREPPGSNQSTYDRYCNTGNPKFARFAKFLEAMH